MGNVGLDLKYDTFPVDTLIKNHIRDESQCNYEIYLLELLNHSQAMLSLGNKESYTRIEGQSHGECDCESGKYKIDFKLLCSTSYLKARQASSPSEQKLASGVIAFSTPPQPKTEFTYVDLLKALKGLDKEQLHQIQRQEFSRKDTKEHLLEKDLSSFWKSIEKKKNLFMLLPLDFHFDNGRNEEDAINELKCVLIECLSLSFEASTSRQNYDTFVTFIYDRFFRIFQYTGSTFNLIDSISIFEIKSFDNLAIHGLDRFSNNNFLRKFSSPEEFEQERKNIINQIAGQS